MRIKLLHELIPDCYPQSICTQLYFSPGNLDRRILAKQWGRPKVKFPITEDKFKHRYENVSENHENWVFEFHMNKKDLFDLKLKGLDLPGMEEFVGGTFIFGYIVTTRWFYIANGSDGYDKDFESHYYIFRAEAPNQNRKKVTDVDIGIRFLEIAQGVYNISNIELINPKEVFNDKVCL